MGHYDTQYEEYDKWLKISGKVKLITANPDNYTIEEISTLLDGLYQFGNPTDPNYTYTKTLLKGILDRRLQEEKNKEK